MRFRGKSIRRKIVALLLLPLVCLTAIWGFAMVLTSREAGEMASFVQLVDALDGPVEDAVRALEQERRDSLVLLADPRSADVAEAMRRDRGVTDRAIAQARKQARTDDVQDSLNEDSAQRLTAMLEAFEGVHSARDSVDARSNDNGIRPAYDEVVDPCYAFLTSVQGVNDVDLAKQGQAVVSLARARELLSREDAVVAAALTAGHMNATDIRTISDLKAQRTLLYDTNLPQLPADEQGSYDRYWRGNATSDLRVAEEAFAKASPGEPHAMGKDQWNKVAERALTELARRDAAAIDRYKDRVRPVAVGSYVRAGVAGVIGLAALLVSVFLSVRIGRGLIHDLRTLRTEAHEASGIRLPAVMRRLASGEEIDVETEAPRLDYDKDEIGQVGQALNTLQRAAVEAAVRQAEMRRGVSEVFVNLARRSQVLLHKQLTLLDSMERRTEDTEELADLFRLDHLTTRMRRHAEGLVILSGVAPSRQWRKPVQLMDVVRASVAEVEDYERIEVRRLARVAVAGAAVPDLTHLIAELLENATVFSPPHTAVQVLGERVANGFTLEIHDRGLGMAPEVLLDANLRLAETPEFELSDTDRLGLFVVSRLAQRQDIRVSLQPSPYGGTTAVVFIPDTLLEDGPGGSDDTGSRRIASLTDRSAPGRGRGAAHSGRLSGLLDGPVELETPTGAAALGDFPDDLDDGGPDSLFGPRRSLAGVQGEQHEQAAPGSADERARTGRPDGAERPGGGLAPLPRRGTPKLVSSHGRPVAEDTPKDSGAAEDAGAGKSRGTTTDRGKGQGQGAASDLPRRRRPAQTAIPQRDTPPGAAPLPRRVRQASLAPQLKSGPDRRTAADTAGPQEPPVERDAEEVRSRMASLQRGWQRGRQENAAAAGDESPGGPAQGTTSEGDGR